jgi:hypothetical protein
VSPNKIKDPSTGAKNTAAAGAVAGTNRALSWEMLPNQNQAQQPQSASFRTLVETASTMGAHGGHGGHGSVNPGSVPQGMLASLGTMPDTTALLHSAHALAALTGANAGSAVGTGGGQMALNSGRRGGHSGNGGHCGNGGLPAVVDQNPHYMNGNMMGLGGGVGAGDMSAAWAYGLQSGAGGAMSGYPGGNNMHRAMNHMGAGTDNDISQTGTIGSAPS